MSAAEDAARLGLGHSVEKNREQVGMTDESRRLLADLIEERMCIAVAEGIQAAMTDEAARRFTLAMLETMQEQAAHRAGLLVLGGVKKAVGVGAIVLAVWVLGGWSAAKAVLGAMTKG
jgi:hypothetical protein